MKLYLRRRNASRRVGRYLDRGANSASVVSTGGYTSPHLSASSAPLATRRRYRSKHFLVISESSPAEIVENFTEVTRKDNRNEESVGGAI